MLFTLNETVKNKIIADIKIMSPINIPVIAVDDGFVVAIYTITGKKRIGSFSPFSKNVSIGYMSESPSLVEPDVRDFIENSLKRAHEYKMNTYTFFLNFGVAAIFFIVFGGFLYYRYKTKPSPYEIQQKMKRDQEIIMSKIQMYQDDKKRAGFSGITKIPFVDTDYYLR